MNGPETHLEKRGHSLARLSLVALTGLIRSLKPVARIFQTRANLSTFIRLFSLFRPFVRSPRFFFFFFANADFLNSREHIRRAHFKHLQCPHNGCTFYAGSPFEIYRHQRANHPPPQLNPIEQTTNLDDFHRNKALGLKNLTWEMISQICFSMDYTREKLRKSSEVDGGRYEIEDEGNSCYVPLIFGRYR